MLRLSSKRRTPVFAGDLQAEVMATVWRLGEATVERVRADQALGSRSAYTTVQTVMKRLADRGLLKRKRRGKAYIYSPAYAESEYVARAIGERLAQASPDARRAALLNLVDRLDEDELDELARQANRLRRRRGSD